MRKQRLIRPGKRLAVAVSGGADSVALLRLLLELREETGFPLAVIHFNHQLRGRNSDADERFVRKLAQRYELDFFVGRENIAARAKKERGNIEEVARRARYEFFEKWVSYEFMEHIAVAHTADDQAETILAHILRGTGLRGLRGIHPQTGNVFRPLLGVRRSELRNYLESIGQSWREDKSNQDTGRTRAKIRKQLLPLLEKKFNAGVVEHLCRLGELAAEDEQYLEAQAGRWLGTAAKQSGDEVSVDLKLLLQALPALRSRALRTMVASVKNRSGQLSREHVRALIEMAEQQESGKILQLPGGVEVRRERAVLRFRAAESAEELREGKCTKEFEYPIDLRGGECELRLVELSCVLHFREIDWPPEGRETKWTGAALDRSRLVLPLVVRNGRPGDAMRPGGHQRVHKLGRLLNERSVSRWEKEKLPVVASGGKLAWVRGLPVSVEFAVGPETQRAVVITEEPLT